MTGAARTIGGRLRAGLSAKLTASRRSPACGRAITICPWPRDRCERTAMAVTLVRANENAKFLVGNARPANRTFA